jgi:hypothetical protein
MRRMIHHVHLVINLPVILYQQPPVDIPHYPQETLMPLQVASLELALCLLGTPTRLASKLLSQIRRGKPDADASKSIPAALLALSRRREP